MPEAELSAVARALGRVPTGLYVVTANEGGRPLGFVGSFVMQVGFEPPTVCVAIGSGREHLRAIRETEVFGLSILDGESQALMRPFFKRYTGSETPFDALDVTSAPLGSPILSGALAWLECRLSGEHACGDHVVVFGEVTAAEQLREGDPAIHLRKNGLGY